MYQKNYKNISQEIGVPLLTLYLTVLPSILSIYLGASPNPGLIAFILVEVSFSPLFMSLITYNDLLNCIEDFSTSSGP